MAASAGHGQGGQGRLYLDGALELASEGGVGVECAKRRRTWVGGTECAKDLWLEDD